MHIFINTDSAKPKLRILLFAIALCASSAVSAMAEGFTSQFQDSLDGRFDVSQWLASRYGFMPLANIITEPAVGFGIGGGLVFLHQSYADALTSGSPASMSALGGFLTENGTWGVMAFHQGYYKQDTIRYTGALGYMSPQLAIYRELPPPQGTVKIGFNIEGWVFSQELSLRLGDTPVFLGGQYQYFGNEVKFDLPGNIIDVDPEDLKSQIGGIGPIVTYDTRDNVFTPDRGLRSRLLYRYYDDFLGSDHRFHRADWLGIGYTNHYESLVIGLRADARFAWGDTPFYSQPFIDLRGIPAMRYQGEQVYVVETEVRWDFVDRWSLVAFTGVGRAVVQSGAFTDGDNAWAGGAGFRYLIARLFGIRAGVDVARGPEDWAVYIPFGSAWSRY